METAKLIILASCVIIGLITLTYFGYKSYQFDKNTDDKPNKPKSPKIVEIVFNHTIQYIFTEEFFKNCKFVYIKYFGDLSQRHYICRSNEHGIIVLCSEDHNGFYGQYKVYDETEVFPCRIKGIIKGYWRGDGENSVFCITECVIEKEIRNVERVVEENVENNSGIIFNVKEDDVS